MSDFSTTAVLGCGVIGASWAALFLASGRKVAAYDPDPDAEKATRAYIARTWESLLSLGAAQDAIPVDNLRFHKELSRAVEGALFVQESVPERLDVKHELYRAIERELPSEGIIASSSSGLTLGKLQKGWENPARFVLGHPFNPPHLIPLVEVMGNELTAAGTVQRTMDFYKSLGKITIELRREAPGHVANRLQAALWREAIHLAKEGIASVEDIDKAVWAGPGLRWAAMGPSQLFHLGAGAGGIEEFCRRYATSFNDWWGDLGTPHMDDEVAALLQQGVTEINCGESLADLSERRDALVEAILKATTSLRDHS